MHPIHGLRMDKLGRPSELITYTSFQKIESILDDGVAEAFKEIRIAQKLGESAASRRSWRPKLSKDLGAAGRRP